MQIGKLNEWLSYVYKITMLSIFATCLIFPSFSSATSCKDLVYRIYGNCIGNECNDLIFIDAKPGYGTCSRMHLVKDGEPIHKQILEYELKQNTSAVDGTYELVMKRDWYFPDYKLHELRDYLVFYKNADTIPERSASAKFKKIRVTNIELLEKRWIDKSVIEKREQNRNLIVYSLVLVVGLAPLFISAYYFTGWIRNSARWRNVKISTALQVSAIGFGFLFVDHLRFGLIGAICIVLGTLLLSLEVLILLGFIALRRLRNAG